jgi:hypothetical protein
MKESHHLAPTLTQQSEVKPAFRSNQLEPLSNHIARGYAHKILTLKSTKWKREVSHNPMLKRQKRQMV